MGASGYQGQAIETLAGKPRRFSHPDRTRIDRNARGRTGADPGRSQRIGRMIDLARNDAPGRQGPSIMAAQPLAPTSLANVSRRPMVRLNTGCSGVESLSRTK